MPDTNTAAHLKDEATGARPIPVLDHNIYTDPSEDENKRLFRQDLAAWCSQWTLAVSLPIMARADELYEQPSVRILARRWRIADEGWRAYRKRLLIDAARTGSWEETDIELHRSDREAYGTALHALLVR